MERSNPKASSCSIPVLFCSESSCISWGFQQTLPGQWCFDVSLKLSLECLWRCLTLTDCSDGRPGGIICQSAWYHLCSFWPPSWRLWRKITSAISWFHTQSRWTFLQGYVRTTIGPVDFGALSRVCGYSGDWCRSSCGLLGSDACGMTEKLDSVGDRTASWSGYASWGDWMFG